MKKIIITFVSLALLSGCGQDNEKNPEQSQTDRIPSESNSNSTEEGTIEHDHGGVNGLDSLPEFELLSKNIDLNQFTGVVETDNPGNRILLFENEDGVKIYKSVLVKKTNLLKIIKLDDDGLVYKGLIE